MISRIWLRIKCALFVQSSVKRGANFHIGFGSFVSTAHELTIGDNVYIGKYCSIHCSGRIGSEVLIANSVGIVGRYDHDFRAIGSRIRSSRSVRSDESLATHPRNLITIGDDVWVGYGVVLLSGIEIGRGAIISAGAVVFNDVPEYAIMRGNPAVIVGYRFSPEQIVLHECSLSRSNR